MWVPVGGCLVPEILESVFFNLPASFHWSELLRYLEPEPQVIQCGSGVQLLISSHTSLASLFSETAKIKVLIFWQQAWNFFTRALLQLSNQCHCGTVAVAGESNSQCGSFRRCTTGFASLQIWSKCHKIFYEVWLSSLSYVLVIWVTRNQVQKLLRQDWCCGVRLIPCHKLICVDESNIHPRICRISVNVSPGLGGNSIHPDLNHEKGNHRDSE